MNRDEWLYVDNWVQCATIKTSRPTQSALIVKVDGRFCFSHFPLSSHFLHTKVMELRQVYTNIKTEDNYCWRV